MLIGGVGLRVAVLAKREAKRANELAKESNQIAKDANSIAEATRDSSERTGREQVELQRQGMLMQETREKKARTANIEISNANSGPNGLFGFKVKNTGPHTAYDMEVTFHYFGKGYRFGQVKELPFRSERDFADNLSNIFGSATFVLYREGMPMESPGEHEGTLKVAFTDGAMDLTTFPNDLFIKREKGPKNKTERSKRASFS